MKILVLNSGSSSQKACLYDLAGKLPDAPSPPLWEGKIEWRDDSAKLKVRASSGVKTEQKLKRGDRSEATANLLQALLSGETCVLSQLSDIDVVGHRIVNGGRKFTSPTVVTAQVKAAIAEMAKFAPLHNCVELEGIALIVR
jgi:acetate kinase